MHDSNRTSKQLIDDIQSLAASLAKPTQRLQAVETVIRSVHDQQAEIAALQKSSRSLLEHRTFESTARAIFDSCKALVGATAGYVSLLNEDETENDVLFLDAGDLVCAVDPNLPMPIRGLRGEAYHLGAAVYENDFPRCKHASFLPPGHVELRNAMFVPLVIDGKAVGLMGLANKPGGFTDEDLQKALPFGGLAAVALKNSRTLEALSLSREALSKAHDELERKVEQRTEQLKLANEQLQTEIAKQKRMQEEKDRLLKAIETTKEAIHILAPDLTITYANRALDKLFGYGTGELIGKHVSILNAGPTPKETAGQIEHAIHDNGWWEGEVGNIARNGAEFITYATISAVKDANGEILNYISTQHDITEQKEAQKRAQQHQSDLARIWRINTVGEMASGLAHELNQPLCAILNYANASRRIMSKNPKQTEKVAEALDQIAEQAERAGQIIRRIRSLISRREPHKSTVDINLLIRESIETVKSEATHAGIVMQTTLAENLPTTFADHIEISEVILNLLRNAIDAVTDPNAEQANISIRTSAPNKDLIEVAVSDTGIGLSPETENKVFDSFFTTKPEGLGIGLSLSRTIIEAHRGAISVQPNPDRGVTFKFTLPIEDY